MTTTTTTTTTTQTTPSFHVGQRVTYHRSGATNPAIVISINNLSQFMTCRVDTLDGVQVYQFHFDGARCLGAEFGRVEADAAPRATALRLELDAVVQRCRQATGTERMALQYKRCELTEEIRAEERK